MLKMDENTRRYRPLPNKIKEKSNRHMLKKSRPNVLVVFSLLLFLRPTSLLTMIT
jgi:hypothetical protein